MSNKNFFNQKDFERIKRECFWDVRLPVNSIDELRQLILKSDRRYREYLIAKIFENSSNVLKDLHLFDVKDIRLFLEKYNISGFKPKEEFFERRKQIVEYFFLGNPLEFDDLLWNMDQKVSNE